MATKKSAVKKAAPEKTLLVKIAEGAGQLAGELSVKKDQLMEKASDVIASAKETFHIIGTSKPAVAPKKKAATIAESVKKKAVVAPKKKAATIVKSVKKKAVVAPKKKVETVKKAVKKKVAVAVKKIEKAVTKKSAPAKKAIKKVAKKIAAKK